MCTPTSFRENRACSAVSPAGVNSYTGDSHTRSPVTASNQPANTVSSSSMPKASASSVTTWPPSVERLPVTCGISTPSISSRPPVSSVCS